MTTCRSCNYCHALYHGNPPGRCGGCKTVFYCNSDCQKSDWSNHKKQCKIWRKETKISGNILQNKKEDQMINNLIVDLWNISKKINIKSILKRGWNLHPLAVLNRNNIIQTQQDVMNGLKNVFAGTDHDKYLIKLISEFVCNDNDIDHKGFATLLLSAFDNNKEKEWIKQISINRDKIQFFRERTEYLRYQRNQSFSELFAGLNIPNMDENVHDLSEFRNILLNEFDTQNGPFCDQFPDEEEGKKKVRSIQLKIYQFINLMKSKLKGVCIIEMLADVLNTCSSGYFMVGKTSGGHFVGYFFVVPWR